MYMTSKLRSLFEYTVPKNISACELKDEAPSLTVSIINPRMNLLSYYKQAINVHNYARVPKTAHQHHIAQTFFQDHMLE
jgi:hypothetical protein